MKDKSLVMDNVDYNNRHQERLNPHRNSWRLEQHKGQIIWEKNTKVLGGSAPLLEALL